MKWINQLVSLTLGFSLFGVLVSSVPNRHAAAAPATTTSAVNAAKIPRAVGERSKGSVAIGAVAAHLVGRILVDATGTAQWIGYCPYLAGITGPFFSGTPSEATAYFTFRSTLFQEQAISNGDLIELFPNAVGGPLEIRVYLNGSPNGDFQNPDTFSDGLLIARLQPERAMGTYTGSLTFAAGTYDVVSGSDFTFQGQTYNIKKLTRSLTISLTFGAPHPGGTVGAAVVSSFGGYALAAAKPEDMTDLDSDSDRAGRP